MQRDEIRKIITEQFYNSLTASGVQINAIPSGQLRALVEAMADGLIAAIAAAEQEGDVPLPAIEPGGAGPNRAPTPDEPNAPQSGEEAQEEKVWQGRPYLSIGTRYELTSQRLRIYRGILANRIEEIELIRVKDSNVNQHMGERMLNIGDVTIVSADPSAPEIVLQNVHDPIYVRELVRKTVMTEKSRRGLYYREDIGDENP
jgi:hypothetical protein